MSKSNIVDFEEVSAKELARDIIRLAADRDAKVISKALMMVHFSILSELAISKKLSIAEELLDTQKERILHQLKRMGWK